MMVGKRLMFKEKDPEKIIFRMAQLTDLGFIYTGLKMPERDEIG